MYIILKCMKKIFIILGLAIALGGVVTFCKVGKGMSTDSLLAANIEALTNNESDDEVIWHVSNFECEFIIKNFVDIQIISSKLKIPVGSIDIGRSIDLSSGTVKCQLASWWNQKERCPGVITCNDYQKQLGLIN